jgi:hypothetical protein
MRWTALFITLALVFGCHAKRSPTDAGYPTTMSALEISTSPMILATQQDQWKHMTLYGVHLGDAESALPKAQIVEQINGGWICMTNGNKYLSGNDNHIDALGVCEKKLIDQLNIPTKNDIAKVFGPDGVPVDAGWGTTIFYFHDRHVRVVWNLVENRVTAVDIWK